MVQPRLLQRRPHPDSLPGDLFRQLRRARFRAPGARLQRRCRPIHCSPFSDRIERLPGDPVLSTERRHRSPRGIRRPLNDGETDTRINRFNTAHPSNIEAEVSGPNATKVSDGTNRKYAPKPHHSESAHPISGAMHTKCAKVACSDGQPDSSCRRDKLQLQPLLRVWPRKCRRRSNLRPM